MSWRQVSERIRAEDSDQLRNEDPSPMMTAKLLEWAEREIKRLRQELEAERAALYQCKKEREILSRNLSAFTGNA